MFRLLRLAVIFWADRRQPGSWRGDFATVLSEKFSSLLSHTSSTFEGSWRKSETLLTHPSRVDYGQPASNSASGQLLRSGAASRQATRSFQFSLDCECGARAEWRQYEV